MIPIAEVHGAIGLGLVHVDVFEAGATIDLNPSPKPWIVFIRGFNHGPDAFDQGILHLAFALSKGAIIGYLLDPGDGCHLYRAILEAKLVIGRPIIVIETGDSTHLAWNTYVEAHAPRMIVYAGNPTGVLHA